MILLHDCISLEYINIYNFIDANLDLDYIFYDLVDNIVYCLNSENETKYEELLPDTIYKNCAVNDCSNNWKKKRKKIVPDEDFCVDDCRDQEINKYEYEYTCYSQCPKDSHSIKGNIYFCEKNIDKCIANFPFINLENNSCSEVCDINDFFNNKCTINIMKNKYLILSNYISNLKEEMRTGLLNKLLINIKEDKEDLIHLNDNTLYQITSSLNQNNKLYNHFSTIKLGKCEKILKQKNNILVNEPLIILKIEQYFKEIIIPLIQYEIFNPNNNEKLDLKECINNNIMLNISIPIFINENNLDKYDPKNIYYTNLCFNNSNEDGTDIPLYDRINEFNNHYSLCPKDCSYLEYDLENKKVICECQIKDGFSFKKEITKEDLTSKLYLRKYLTNFNVFKCYKLLFSIDGWTNNIGNYIILFIIFIYLLLILIFYLIEYKILYGHINNIINLKIHENDKDHGKNFKESINENIKKLFPSYQKFKNNNIKNKLNKSSSESRTESNIIVNKNINLNERNKYQTNKKTIVKTLEYIDYEINIISFDEAIELDKRTYCQYYFSLIKSKHILLSNIFLIKDYNSHIIKISILLFSISLHLIINACFFNDSLLHIIYIKKGNINFNTKKYIRNKK